MLDIQPTLTIAQACQETDRHSLFFRKDDRIYRVLRMDLDKMLSMGLGDLPVDSIAVPEVSPMLAPRRVEVTAAFDFSRQLTSYFPVYFVAALYEMQSLINRLELHAYVVGGITRDMLLYGNRRLEIQDVDVTVEGNAIELAGFLAENSRNFQLSETFPEFGTAKVQYKDSLMLDFASTRKEVYPHSGALPVIVARGVPLADDIGRRDFTVNSLAFSIHDLGKVLDYTSGIEDIENEELRVLQPVSFFEDPSRILRGLKFASRFDFHFTTDTRILLEKFFQYGARHYKGGGERIKQELKGFLTVAESEAKLKRLRFFIRNHCYRLMNMELAPHSNEEMLFERLKAVSEKLPKMTDTLRELQDPEIVFLVYLAFLCEDMNEADFAATAKRLGLTRHERESIEKFRLLRAEGRFKTLHEFSSPYEVYNLFHGQSLATVAAGMIDVSFTDKAHYRILLEAFQKYRRKWEGIHPELDGKILLELGVPPGKEVGNVLKQLLQAKLGGRLPDRIDEIHFVQELLKPKEEELPTDSSAY